MSAVAASDCIGLWRRTLLVEADGSRDTATDVTWLQGVTAFVDSRGFAGTLEDNGGVFEWHRAVDVEAPGPPDVGEMRWEGDTLVETGVHADYVEHWVRDNVAPMPCWAVYLTGPDGGPGVLLRVGDRFGFAGAGQVVIGEVGSPEWACYVTGEDTVQANDVLWTIERREGITEI
ncbi:hypothetical protein C6A85_000000111745 [Mycobacterium sp. ITM-2017-0098]|nr:hypothetical protein C6A85_000000111745 [Mycobacterium sp. ITM-2017-0098]